MFWIICLPCLLHGKFAYHVSSQRSHNEGNNRETETGKFMLRQANILMVPTKVIKSVKSSLYSIKFIHHLKSLQTTSSYFSDFNSIQSSNLSAQFTIQFHIVLPYFLQLRLPYQHRFYLRLSQALLLGKINWPKVTWTKNVHKTTQIFMVSSYPGEDSS